MDVDHRIWEDRALDLARGVLGRTSPNPAVGAVLVRDDVVVSEGATQSPGGPHAGVVALHAAGTKAGNKGYEYAVSAIEIATLWRAITDAPSGNSDEANEGRSSLA